MISNYLLLVLLILAGLLTRALPALSAGGDGVAARALQPDLEAGSR